MRLEKEFSSFKEGLQELINISYSAEQALLENGVNPLDMEDAETQANMNLAANSNFRPTGNGVDWNIFLEVSPYGTRYRTSGGLVFGWEVDSREYQPAYENTLYIFYLYHPSGKFPKGSTLLKAGLDAGWEVE